MPPRPTLLKTLLRGAAGSGLGVAARAAGALILNKAFATLAPAGGLTQLAQFQNLMALFTTLSTDGVQVGVVQRLAPLRPGSPRHRAVLGAALALNTGLLLAATLLGGLLTGEAWSAGLRGWGSWLIFGGGMALVVAQGMLGAALLAAGRLRYYVTGTVALAALGTAAGVGALAGGWPLRAALLAYLGGQGLALLPALLLAGRAGLLAGGRWLAPPSRAALRGLGSFLLMAGSNLLFGRAVDFVLRAHLLHTYGPARTDLWQAVVKLSDNYTLLVGTLLATVFYPRLAALAGQPAAARTYVRHALALLAPALALGLGLVWALRDWLLPLLFAPRLLAARDLLAPQVLGDWAKLLGWVLIYQLVARARTGAYVAVQAGSAVAFGALLGWLLPRYGPAGALWANAGRYALVLLGCLGWEVRRRILA